MHQSTMPWMSFWVATQCIQFNHTKQATNLWNPAPQYLPNHILRAWGALSAWHIVVMWLDCIIDCVKYWSTGVFLPTSNSMLQFSSPSNHASSIICGLKRTIIGKKKKQWVPRPWCFGTADSVMLGSALAPYLKAVGWITLLINPFANLMRIIYAGNLENGDEEALDDE